MQPCSVYMYILFALSTFCYQVPSWAYVSAIDIFTAADGKKIFLLGDAHEDNLEETHKQRRDLKNFVQALSHQTDVYIEDYALSDTESIPLSRLLHSFIPYLASQHLPNAHIQSIEIGPVTSAFTYMLSYYEACILPACRRFSAFSGIQGTCEEWTIQNLFDEYTNYFNEFKRLTNALPYSGLQEELTALSDIAYNKHYAMILRIFNVHLKHQPTERLSMVAFKGYIEFAKRIALFCTSHIIEQAEQTYQEVLAAPDLASFKALWPKLCVKSSLCSVDMHFKGKAEVDKIPRVYRGLEGALFHATRPLVTYYTAAKILSDLADTTHNAVVCSGAYHTKELTELLAKHTDYKHIYHAGIYENCADVKPLNLEVLLQYI